MRRRASIVVSAVMASAAGWLILISYQIYPTTTETRIDLMATISVGAIGEHATITNSTANSIRTGDPIAPQMPFRYQSAFERNSHKEATSPTGGVPPTGTSSSNNTSNTAVIGSIITASVAIVGIAITSTLSTLTRRDAQKEKIRQSLHEASEQLSSERAAERIVGLEVAVNYLPDPEAGESARRLLISGLQYESESIITFRAAASLTQHHSRLATIADLAAINREMWRDTTQAFQDLCANKNKNPATDQPLAEKLALLRQNQHLLGLVARGSRDGDPISDIDLSHTYLPDLSIFGSRWKGCNFRESLLPYSDLRDSTFIDCDMTRSILIGSYMEGAVFERPTTANMIVTGARLPPPALEALVQQQDSITSIAWELEYNWYGQ